MADHRKPPYWTARTERSVGSVWRQTLEEAEALEAVVGPSPAASETRIAISPFDARATAC
jgi:hypothetical protein